MRTKPNPDGSTQVDLDKAECRRLLEASYILRHLERVTGDSTWGGVATDVESSAMTFGKKYVTPEGTLSESPRRQAIDASAPE